MNVYFRSSSHQSGKTRMQEQQKIINKLQELWELHPELRLCQLISNLHACNAPDPNHIYGTPDETLERWLDEVYFQHLGSDSK